MESVNKREAQVVSALNALKKKGFERVGDTFYSPETIMNIEDGRPPWSERTKNISRVRAFLFVL